METITKGNKLFKSGKFLMTAAATVAVVVSATATTLTSINADDSVAPAKVTTSQKAAPSENHTYNGKEFDAPIRVETHAVWTANSENVIADNMSKQGIKSVDQLGDYNVVWGDTLSTIAAHFHVDTNELAQRFGIVDVNYIGAGITMKDQANINALESQVIHDAQWNGQYNAKVSASQASDATQPAVASDGANAQANAAAATPAAQAPAANTDVPAQAATSSDTHVGATKTDETPVATPADNNSKGADTNIGGTSEVIKSVDGGANTPAAQPAPKAPVVATPKTDAPAPATNTDKGADTNIGGASEVIKSIDSGSNTPATQPATEAPVEAQKPVVETPKTEVPAAPATTPATPAQTVAPKTEAPAPKAPVEAQVPASEVPAANDKPVIDAPLQHTVPENPVDGSTFFAMDPASNESFSRSFGTLTYHTSFSGISVSDLTHGSEQGLWLDPSGNALNPNNPVQILYTKAIIDRMVTRYIDAQKPVEGTELERPDQLTGNAPTDSTNVGSASDVMSSIIGG